MTKYISEISLALAVVLPFTGCEPTVEELPPSEELPAIAAEEAILENPDTVPPVDTAETFVIPRGRWVPPADTNSAGRWTATQAQRDSVEIRTGFGNKVAYPFFGDCPPVREVDSIVFGSIEFSDITGDASGFQFVFQRQADSISGVAYKAAGGIQGPLTLQGVERAGDAPEVRFWLTTGGRNIYYYTAQLTCDALVAVVRHRVIPDARYDDAGYLGAENSWNMERADSAITKFPSG